MSENTNNLAPIPQSSTHPATNYEQVGRGHEEPSDLEDMEVPRAKLIQFTSEEAQATDPDERRNPGSIINSITKEELEKETNSEISRAWLERLGPKEYFKRMEVKKIDAWIDNATGLHYELFDFINRRGELQPRVLKMESPKLNDGTQPVYIEMVDPKLETAQAARRWQFQKEDGTWPSVEECNKNPS